MKLIIEGVEYKSDPWEFTLASDWVLGDKPICAYCTNICCSLLEPLRYTHLESLYGYHYEVYTCELFKCYIY